MCVTLFVSVLSVQTGQEWAVLFFFLQKLSCLHNNTRCWSGVALVRGLMMDMMKGFYADIQLCYYYDFMRVLSLTWLVLTYYICCLSYEALCDLTTDHIN